MLNLYPSFDGCRGNFVYQDEKCIA